MATKKVFLFAMMGLLSGVVCWALQFVLPETQWIIDYYPAVVLGVFLFIAGEYIAGAGSMQKVATLVVLVIVSMLGWRLAIQVGYDLGGPVPFGNAGALGALIMALGLLLAWRLRGGILKFVTIVTAFGAVGGVIFHFLDKWFIGAMEQDDIWILILFAEWQSIFMVGVAVALHYRLPR